MAVIKFSNSVQAMQGKISGSVLCRDKKHATIHSNNWSKRGHTWAAYQERAQMSAVSSQWRSLSQEDRNAWLYYAKPNPNVAAKNNGIKYSYSTINEGNGFTAICSKLAHNIKAPAKPPRKASLPWTYGIGYNVNVGTDLYGFYIKNIQFEYSWGLINLFAGPFCPVWKTYPTTKVVNIASGLETVLNPNFNFSGDWELYYGAIPPDPGYICWGAQAWIGYDRTPENFQPLTDLVKYIDPLNGAPPYHPT